LSLRAVAVLLSFALPLSIAAPAAAQDPPPNPRVLVQTSEGDFEMELFRDEPSVIATVVNFLGYVRDGYYDGTVFHRVIRDVIIQGGGFSVDADNMLVPKSEGLRGQILHQGSFKLKNARGTVAMARGAGPNTARQQIFINLEANMSFDFKNPTPAGVGYTVFGRVTDGMNVVRNIGRTRTGSQGPLQDVPNEPVIITSITRVEGN
jgi:cyclophilin family peptidyl-prolyl cis-trans isomerase